MMVGLIAFARYVACRSTRCVSSQRRARKRDFNSFAVKRCKRIAAFQE